MYWDWHARDKIKQSNVYKDAYMTHDYARAIHKEQRILISAMMKARNERGLKDTKVIERHLACHRKQEIHYCEHPGRPGIILCKKMFRSFSSIPEMECTFRTRLNF